MAPWQTWQGDCADRDYANFFPSNAPRAQLVADRTLAMNDSETANPTDIWDKRYEEGELACTKETPSHDPIDYTQHPFLYKQAIAKRLTGNANGNPLRTICQKYLSPSAAKMLAVGSGLAIVEESLVRDGFVDKLVAFEASKVAVETARERIARNGLSNRIEMRCGDVMQAGIEAESFDAVFVQAAIHHFYEIEEMFAFFHRILKPGGLIIYDEYVGPDHHMYEESVMSLMDEVNDSLSDEYRFDVIRNQIRNEVPQATLEWMLEMDPSEGVHASKILPLTYKYFDVMYRNDYGGTFMRPFFVGILPNFDFENEKDKTVARLIILIEDLLIRSGMIPSYHTVVVAKKLEQIREELPDEANINFSNWEGLKKFGQLAQGIVHREFNPANHSDENWDRGINRSDAPVFFMHTTRYTQTTLKPGKSIIFANGETRQIVDVRSENDSLIITLSGESLDPNVFGYPSKFQA